MCHRLQSVPLPLPPGALLRVDAAVELQLPRLPPRALGPTRTSASISRYLHFPPPKTFPPPKQRISTLPNIFTYSPQYQLRALQLSPPSILGNMYAKTVVTVALALLASSATAQTNTSSVDIGAIPGATKSTPLPWTFPLIFDCASIILR